MHLPRLAPPALAALLTVLVAAAPAAAKPHGHGHDRANDGKFSRIVVIYEENHSFDNLYGGWEGVDGLASADPAHTRQVAQDGSTYKCLLQNDVNLTSPDPLPSTCTGEAFPSAFTNAPFRIEDYIAPSDTTCPPPGVFAANGVRKGEGEGEPGGCTRDLVHRFYQEQYQIDGGKQDRYTTGSDAVGLTQGHYDTRALPIYRYLHRPGHPPYAIADRFFQAAFGGSFLNHQWLVAAATPTYPGAPAALYSKVDSNGMPRPEPLYTPTSPDITTKTDNPLTAPCEGLGKPGLLCGDWAVNTIQPQYQPYAPGTPDANRLPPQAQPTIGDRLSAAGVSWAWYSGGWSNADGDVGAPGWTNGSGPSCGDPGAVPTATYPNCPDKLFQYHHQPLNYFKSFAPGTAMRRDHLRDEQEFLGLAKASRKRCALRSVSFVKPIGAENEHPGYASEHGGSDHLVSLVDAIQRSRCAKDTMIVVTYDEFGGQWDHVPPPGQAGGPAGPSDPHGPGTRIPALVIAKGIPGRFAVDHTTHDTTSVLSTIERRFGLKPLTSRDAKSAPLTSVFKRGQGRPDHGNDDAHGHRRGGRKGKRR